MSDAPLKARSFAIIEPTDLDKLAKIALKKLDDAFKRHPEKRLLYETNFLGICLCQGAADHFLQLIGSKGIHDFDLWIFFRRNPKAPFYNRKGSTFDFIEPKFGRSTEPGLRKYKGRKVDVFWRAIPATAIENGPQAIMKFFANPQTRSARELRDKSAILIWPHPIQTVWRPERSTI
jgi:hypothetical protein